MCLGSGPGAVVRPFAWALRRLRFSRNAAPRRRCRLALSVFLGRSSMAGKIRAGAGRRKGLRATVAEDGPCLRRFGPYGKDRRIRGRISSIHPARRCRSSVVEHSLGKGEVVSSILTGSTTKSPINRGFLHVRKDVALQNRAEQNAKRRAETHQIRPKRSADVHAHNMDSDDVNARANHADASQGHRIHCLVLLTSTPCRAMRMCQ